MKRKLFALCCFLFFAGTASAQTPTLDTIKAANGFYDVPNFASTDHVAGLVVDSTIPSLAPAMAATWDLTQVHYSGNTGFYERTFTPITNYQYGDSIAYYYLGRFNYRATSFNYYVTQGVSRYGEVVAPQSFRTQADTTGLDSISFPSQYILYSAPYNQFAYPFSINLNTSWSSNLSYTTNFTINSEKIDTGNLASPVSADGRRFTKFTEQNNVVGWGKMRLKRNVGDISNYFNVLQVKTVKTVRDSFYITNLTDTFNAKKKLWDTLGFTLIALDTVYRAHDTAHVNPYVQYAAIHTLTEYAYNFYTPYELTPFLKVVYFDATFTNIKSAEALTDRALFPTSFNNVINSSEIAVYPNPVTNRMVTVEIPQSATGKWSYDLINITGQRVAADVLPAGSGSVHIAIPGALATGVYYLRLNNDGKQVTVRPLNIIN